MYVTPLRVSFSPLRFEKSGKPLFSGPIVDSLSRRPENQQKFSTYVTFHEKETADKNEKTSAIARMSG